MKKLALLTCILAMAFVVSASADQITLGGSSSGTFTFSSPVGGPITMGGGVSSATSGSFESPTGNTILALLPWSITGGASSLNGLVGGVFTAVSNSTAWNFSIGTGANVLTGTIDWTLVKDSTLRPQFLGTLLVASSTGVFAGDYSVGHDYGVDLTVQLPQGTTTLDSIFIGGGRLAGTASSGEIPVPEPASMALFGSGLVGLAGLIRRRLS